MKKTIGAMLALSVLVFSCKKDDDKSTSELVVGKWNVIDVIEHKYDNGVSKRDTTEYTPGIETMELTKDGKAYYYAEFSNGSSARDTMVYTVSGSKLILDGDIFEISKITGSEMQLYSKYVYSATEYDEEWVNCKK